MNVTNLKKAPLPNKKLFFNQADLYHDGIVLFKTIQDTPYCNMMFC